MKKTIFNIKGETLTETIIALSILAIGITVASTIILNSVRNLTNAKNRVIAINIAREGVEAVRSIRDTNWLFYSDKRRTCWNRDPSSGICDGDIADMIEPGVYIVYKHTDQSWRLAPADENVIADGPDGDGIEDNDVNEIRTRLSLVDIDDTIDSDNADGDNNNDTGNEDDRDMYNHKDAVATDSLGSEVQGTPFSRYITIEYLENQPGGDSAIDAPTDSISSLNEWTTAVTDPEKQLLNRMRVTATVEWVKGRVHTASLTTIITDHLGRESLED